MLSNAWKAPHRPLRGARCEFGHIGDVLTDKRIEKYILAGRYGEDMRKRLLTFKAKKKRHTTKQSNLNAALNLLGL